MAPVGACRKMELTHGALFQGIGGFSLAARWAGIPTIWECEIDNYCHELSKKNFPEIKTRYRDIKDMLNEENQIRRVSIVSGGFPCQGFSHAGKRRGKKDDRYLWPQTIEVIKKVRPDWCILENVPGIINLALDDVLNDLEMAGYSWETFIIPALSVGANHRRDRVWIVAHNDRINSNNSGLRGVEISQQQEAGVSGIMADTTVNNARQSKVKPKDRGRSNSKRIGGKFRDEPCGPSKAMADTKCKRQRLRNNENEKIFMDGTAKRETRSPIPEGGDSTKQGLQNGSEKTMGEQRKKQKFKRSNWWAIEPGVGRVAHGVSGRMDRLKGLGNAVVPQIPYIFFEFIKEIENETQK